MNVVLSQICIDDRLVQSPTAEHLPEVVANLFTFVLLTIFGFTLVSALSSPREFYGAAI